MKKIRCPYFELKARGFKFLGSVTVYAYMQSVGLVNDHARFCFRYKELTQTRALSRKLTESPSIFLVD